MVPAALHSFASKARSLAEKGGGRGRRRNMAAGCRPLWLLDPMSSTHNESRLAACPLSGVPGRYSALSTNTRASWKMCSFVWPDWTMLSTSVATSAERRSGLPFSGPRLS